MEGELKMDWLAHAEWPRDEFGHPKHAYEMTPKELDRAAAIVKAAQR